MERLLCAEEPNKKGYVRSIIVAPTKELASQIFDVLKSLLQFHLPSAAMLNRQQDVDSDGVGQEAAQLPPGPYIIPQLLIGGRNKLQEDLATFSSSNPNVLIGTLKRTSEVLQSSRVTLKRHWFDLLVLDEADRLLDPNFHNDLQNILDIVPKERRTGLYSASVSEAVDSFVRMGLRHPFKISAKVRSKSGALDKRTPESLRLYYIVTKPTHKIPTLTRLLEDTAAQKSIVYVSTRAGVDHWDKVLPAILGVTVYPMHGAHKADIRAKNLQRFCDATAPAVLLTTDVLARGIDIPDVDLVVQLDAPTQPKDFIHRCGRSGRAGKRGVAVTLLSQGSEEDYPKYLAIQGTQLEPHPTPPTISDDEATETIARIRRQVTQKRELHDRAQRAFVSWIQAYSKTIPADIFGPQRLDWTETGRAWGLLRWPAMPELRRHLPAAVRDRTLHLAVPPGLDLDALAYSDQAREAKRQEYLAARARGEHDGLRGARRGGAAQELRRRKESAWSGQKEAKAAREARRDRKEVRRTAEGRAKMNDADREKERELAELIGRVREQNAARADAEGESFEGFGD